MTESETPHGLFSYDSWEARFTKYDSDEIRSTCRALQDGARVLINKRERPLRVRTVEDCPDEPVQMGQYAVNLGPDGHCVHLEGNGTRYEIHVPKESASKATMLRWPSGEQIVGYIDEVRNGEIYEPDLRSSVTVADMFGGDVR